MALAAGPSRAAVRYNVIDIPTPPPGYKRFFPFSMNNNGLIVGEIGLPPSGMYHAVLLDPTAEGCYTDLGTLGGRHSAAYSINNNGKIVGYYADSNDYTSNAAMFNPDDPANNIKLADDSAASSINDKGRIAGAAYFYHEDPNKLTLNAALFDPNAEAGYINLGTLDGYTHSVAWKINNAGQIVGQSYNQWWMPELDSRATMFDPTGQPNNIDLGTLGGRDSTAKSINDRGHIVGSAQDANGCVYATLFDPKPGANNLNLGTLSGYPCSAAYSINNKGWIVGAVSLSPLDNPLRAVLFDRKLRGNNTDLNDCIDPALGCTLARAVCINDNGWILCRGGKSGADTSEFLLKPVSAGPADFEPDTDVDLEDFAVLAAAWKTTPAQPNWNPSCDISDPQDQLIDERDLAIFAANYLTAAP
jgi:uncharacterized membrane protein